jgi:hypothetical protein
MTKTTLTFGALTALFGLYGCGTSVPHTEPAANSNTSGEVMIVDFSSKPDVSTWNVQDDVVMGGVSSGKFFINEAGNGVFTGKVSLENNGGFSSVQHYFDPMDVSACSTAMIRLKGDGKRYQFRVESDRRERHSYVYTFETTGEWQTVEIPLSKMTPQFRGRRLNLPNYPGQTMTQVRFLIANGVPESFRLEIDKIWLQ